MNERKWRKFRVSRYTYPTRQTDGSGTKKGKLEVGHIAARARAEQMYGIPMREAVLDHTRGEWIFKFPINKVPEQVRKPLPYVRPTRHARKHQGVK